jgi:hypothetical protein
LAQAPAGELGHIEFLHVLSHDQIARRQSLGITRRLRRARFDAQVTLGEFGYRASPKLPAAQIRDLAALRWISRASRWCSMGQSASEKRMQPKVSGIWPCARVLRCGFSKPAGCWPPWPVGTQIARLEDRRDTQDTRKPS